MSASPDAVSVAPLPRAEHTQASYAVRLEWGPVGGVAVAREADVAVVVDVLSFTTTVAVGVERGMAVLPWRWDAAGAVEEAERRGAVLAVRRSEARRTGGISLSPTSLLAADDVERVLLPSPNGSSLAAALAETGTTVVAASLRNAPAVAAWLAPRVVAGAAVAVVPAGERWPDGSLRPAVEDLWGAGAVVSALERAVDGDAGIAVSPEAVLAGRAFDQVRASLPERLADCSSGRELIADGYRSDVEVAAAYSATASVPLLVDGAFVAVAVTG